MFFIVTIKSMNLVQWTTVNGAGSRCSLRHRLYNLVLQEGVSCTWTCRYLSTEYKSQRGSPHFLEDCEWESPIDSILLHGGCREGLSNGYTRGVNFRRVHVRVLSDSQSLSMGCIRDCLLLALRKDDRPPVNRTRPPSSRDQIPNLHRIVECV